MKTNSRNRSAIPGLVQAEKRHLLNCYGVLGDMCDYRPTAALAEPARQALKAVLDYFCIEDTEHLSIGQKADIPEMEATRKSLIPDDDAMAKKKN